VRWKISTAKIHPNKINLGARKAPNRNKGKHQPTSPRVNPYPVVHLPPPPLG
jgi:hypothetical protein